MRMLPSKSALDFLHIIFTKDVYEVQQRREPRNQKEHWSDLSVDEFKTWLGPYLAMGIVKQPSLRDYWDQSPLTQTPGIAEVMTRNRFFMKFCDTFILLTMRVSMQRGQKTVLIMINSIRSEIY